MISSLSSVRISLILFYISFALTSAGCTKNVKWVEFDTCVDLADYYYDENSVSHTSENIVQVWTRFDFTHEEFPLKESRLLFEFDCTENTYRTIESTEVHRDSKTEHKGSTKKRPVPPVSVYENLYFQVCK
ncbi:MAG: surface-adhesin E family protein [Thermodesulfovibrionales bacterium]